VIKAYWELTKPGILFGNAITAIAGFLLASKGCIDFWLFLAMLAGLLCVIGSACVFNNYIDREMDSKMKRTRNRPLVKQVISLRSAILFGILLGLVGVLLLAYYTNLLALTIALIGFIVYVAIYSPLKHHSVHGTVVGSIAGALPPAVGYCAVTDQFDAAALILFIIVALWQMPHFFAIALYRLDDYRTAGIPVLPVKKGAQVTKIQMLLYIVAFLIALPMLTLFGYTRYLYLVVTLLLGLGWLWLCIQGFWAKNDKVWGRNMFFTSLVVVMGFSLMISLV
jgi:protoheme IX farnesyltransferase